MGRKKSDAYGVGRVQLALQRLGCPDVRPAQGTDEWRRAQGPFLATPDLVAGPLVGHGAPADFLIDVFEPSGEPYVKKRAGNEQAARTFKDAVDARGTFNLGDLGENYEHFYGPLTKKIERYAVSRHASPMLGVAMYFSCLEQAGGVILGHLDAIRALDRAFGIEHHLGEGQVEHCMAEVCSPGDCALLLSMPMSQPLSFVLYVADKAVGQKMILLMNDVVARQAHPFYAHPVIGWLRRLAAA